MFDEFEKFKPKNCSMIDFCLSGLQILLWEMAEDAIENDPDAKFRSEQLVAAAIARAKRGT